jgi:hypothetical protein
MSTTEKRDCCLTDSQHGNQGRRNYLGGCGLGTDYAAGVGIRPGVVRRTQKRFIIDLEVPPSLEDRTAYRRWYGQSLAEAVVIAREYLPRKVGPIRQIGWRASWMSVVGGGKSRFNVCRI